MILSKKQWLYILIIDSFLLISIGMSAQNNINSPYTRFGYGRLNDLGFSRNQAMGGIGYALRTRQNINPANPASFSSIDSTSFIFEFGVSGLFSDFSSGMARQTTFTSNLEYLAFQVPITKWMGLSAGMVPFSFIGYDYGFTDSIAMPDNINSSTNVSYTQSFYGKGGISQVYLGLSASLFNHLAIGVSAYYLFGELSHYRALTFASLENGTLQLSNMYVRSFNFHYGIQYFHTIAQKHDIVVGLVYDHQSKLNGDMTVNTIGVDTTTLEVGEMFDLPNMYAGGISYTYDKRLTLGVDFMFQEFSKTRFMGVTDTLENRAKLAIGAEYIHNPLGNKYIDRMRWRIGANYSQSYVNVKGYNTHDFGITFGIGFPLKTTKTMLNINFEYGNINNKEISLLKENYYKIGLNVNLNELWFFKPKIQ